MKKNIFLKSSFYNVAVWAIVLYLLIPLVATLTYSFSTGWTTTILPEGLTLKWYVQLFQDADFYGAMLRTLLLATVGTLGSIVLVVPTVFVIYVYHPRWMWLLDVLVIASFSVPAVISAMSIMSAYSGSGVPMLVFVIGSYIIGGFPMIQLGTRNSLRAINTRTLIESAEILGASKFEAFIKIILPNIRNGVIASALFRFSTLFGEFGMLNLLVGGAFPNIQIFLRQNMTRSGHYTSAIVISYFVIVTVMTIIGLNLTNYSTKRGASI
jgi:putative spermidine/putrescine transport system permease protein